MCCSAGESEPYWLMHVHCYLHRPNLVPFGHRFPVAPQYILKLKSAEALALVCSVLHGKALYQRHQDTLSEMREK